MASNTAPRKAQSKANQPAPGEKDAGIAASGKRRTDWEAVERDYRTGKFTLRELEEKHKAFTSSISRKAKKDGWTKDLSTAIKQATNAKLTSDLVNTLVNEGAQDVSNAVLAAAEVNTRVILSHRKGLQAITNVKRTLLNQIEQAAANMADLAEIIEMVRNPDGNGIDRANDALKKAMSRSALVDDLKKLADVDEKVRKGEREAFGLDDDPADKQEQQGPKMTDAQLALRITNLMSRTKGAQ